MRLLLAASTQRPGLFGPWLGIGYMGHISGKIADLQLRDPASVSQHDFFLEDRRLCPAALHSQQGRSTARRPLEHRVLDQTIRPFHNAEHRSGGPGRGRLAGAGFSAGRTAALPRCSPRATWARRPHRPLEHVANIVGQPFYTLGTIVEILPGRAGRPPANQVS
ncbi:hypothetical protein ACRAWD_22090 [Caulobacter segnis]